MFVSKHTALECRKLLRLTKGRHGQGARVREDEPTVATLTIKLYVCLKKVAAFVEETGRVDNGGSTGTRVVCSDYEQTACLHCYQLTPNKTVYK